ncbi:MAG TPA: YbaB/EbfC family nucleoid-associated protein [Gemmatimonadaceae bacterium]|nr:YbaB/EbfC family nucleoid-associated protein [Gemmatimonadaceae bacterium]
MPDFLKIIQQAQQMQDRLKQLQDELARLTIVGAAGGGMVTIEADGNGRVRRVSIDPTVVNPADVELLEDLLLAAMGDAQKKAAEAAQVEMKKVTGGMDLPFPFQLPT